MFLFYDRTIDDEYDGPVSRDDLLSTVEMALRKASRFWPKKRVPGDHDRLRLVVQAVADHLALCGIKCFRPPRARPQRARSLWSAVQEWRRGRIGQQNGVKAAQAVRGNGCSL